MDSSSDAFTSFSDESSSNRVPNGSASSDTSSRGETEESAYPSSLSSAPDSFVSHTDATTSTEEEQDEVAMFGPGLVRVTEIFQLFDSIKQQFLTGLGPGLEPVVDVVAIHRTDNLGVMRQARMQSFQIHKAAVESKNGGDPNVRYGWIACRRSEVYPIVRYGFGSTGNNNGSDGRGLYFSPFQASVESVRDDMGEDEEGLRHVLLCRILVGRVEVAGAGQRCPSSEEFDSGVRTLVPPNKCIVWSCNMNTHVLPDFVVSFRATSNLRGTCHSFEPIKMTCLHIRVWLTVGRGSIFILQKFWARNKTKRQPLAKLRKCGARPRNKIKHRPLSKIN
uniref:PARP catalytic domain-containing protein n=1 Tax=Kalanchoe fedtschenkoi TaxID=63787 RepID=A0A7N0VEF9_KALFE